MTPTERFLAARAVLFAHRADPERARAEFRWPDLDAWNWAYDYFDVLAANNARDALRIVDDRDNRVDRISFAELAERSKRVAAYLQASGVKPGDPIIVMLTNTVPLWETLLAAMRIGAIVIPATPQLTPADVDDRIDRGGARHMITDREGAAKLRAPERLGVKLCTGDAPGFVAFDTARSAAATPARVATRAEDPLLLYFTSGTTAKPKLVLHTHASYPVGHLSTMYWIGLQDGDVHWNISSPGWAKHAWSSVFAPWNAGATIVAHEAPRFSARRTLDILAEQQITTLCAPPTVWRMLILEKLGARPPALRELVCAGEPMNPEVIATVQAAWSITLRDGYGQTETTAVVGNSPGLPVVPGSMGKPLPGYDVAMLDRDGKPADDGELALSLSPRPRGLMTGYLDDRARTDEVMAHGFYRTGDEARVDEHGYIHFVGRGDDVFKSSDYRISPFELESILIEHEWVAEAAVVPSPDPVRHTVPKAFVVLKPDVTPSRETAQAIFAMCSDKLAPFKRIRRLEFTTLPKTISGKIRRVELRKREAELRASGARADGEYFLEDFKG